MNNELEALVKALEAYLEAEGQEATRLQAAYLAKLEDVQTRTGRPAATLDKIVRYQYRQWRNAQKKSISTLPPKA